MLYFVVRMVAEIVLGFAGMLVTSWFSRHREYRADEGGAALAGTGNMVAALERLGAVPQTVDPRAPALASFKIAGGARGLMALFSTHPPLEDRIQALRNR